MKLLIIRKPTEFYEVDGKDIPNLVKTERQQVGVYIGDLSEVPSSIDVIQLAGFNPSEVLPIEDNGWSVIKVGDNYSYTLDYVSAYLVSEFSDEDLPNFNTEIILSSVEKYRSGKLIRTYDRLINPAVYLGKNCKKVHELTMDHIKENVLSDYMDDPDYETFEDGFKLSENEVTYLVKFAKAFRVL